MALRPRQRFTMRLDHHCTSTLKLRCLMAILSQRIAKIIVALPRFQKDQRGLARKGCIRKCDQNTRVPEYSIR